MDPFSHFLLGYLITFGVWGPSGLQYVTAGALAGGLPDLDVVFFPVSRWVPALRHRGLSHSIVGVTGIAVVGTLLVPRLFASFFGSGFAAGSPLLYFLALEAGGLSHVLLDAMDHWSVPIFAPFSKREYHFDADRIFNLGAMIFTVGAYAALIAERGRAPIWLWEVTAWTLLAMAVAYMATRLTTRWYAGRVQRRDGYTDVVPQFNPLRFLMVEERSTPEGLRLRYAPYHLRRGRLSEPLLLTIPSGSPGSGSVPDAAAALHRTYAPSLEASWVLGETHHFGEVRETAAGFQVHWYSLEMGFWGRAAGVLAEVDRATGKVSTRTAWRSPGRAA